MHSYKQPILAINTINQKGNTKTKHKSVVMKEILKTKVKTTKLHHNNQRYFSLQITYFQKQQNNNKEKSNKSINILLAKELLLKNQLDKP